MGRRRGLQASMFPSRFHLRIAANAVSPLLASPDIGLAQSHGVAEGGAGLRLPPSVRPLSSLGFASVLVIASSWHLRRHCPAHRFPRV